MRQFGLAEKGTTPSKFRADLEKEFGGCYSCKDGGGFGMVSDKCYSRNANGGAVAADGVSARPSQTGKIRRMEEMKQARGY